MSTSDLVQRLLDHRTLGGVPREQLDWLAERGQIKQLQPGDVLTSSTGTVDGLYVVLAGHLTLRVNRGGGARKLMEWQGGDITGLLPYSRVKAPPGDVIADEPTDLFMVDGAEIPAMIRECHDLTTVLVHVMLDRARVFKSNELLDEKMLSLGRLAAGLAHELNNPASAVARSAKSLVEHLEDLASTSRRFCALTFSGEENVSVVRLSEAMRAPMGRPWSPIELADREDGIAGWLDQQGVNVDPRPLAESSVGVDDLRGLGSAIGKRNLEPVLGHLSADYAVRQLAGDIGTAASRIYTLVAAVKGFTYMDQATVPKPVDVAQGLSDTLTVLRSKAKSKQVDLGLELPVALPSVHGFGGELNQVWANLVDNAIDAVRPNGHVVVSATGDAKAVIVRVVDDGPGIPAEVVSRIFDPFFTTKPIGEGTGLGLDIARRIVQRHNGELDVSTGPAGTEFRVTLPLAPAASAS